MLIDPQTLMAYLGPVLLITGITILCKTLSVLTGALLSGQSLKTSIQSGMSVSQIGEFSFIIATLGLTLKVTSGFLYPIAVAVSAITTFTTPYMIRGSEPLYKWVDKKLPASVKDAINRYSSKPENTTNTGNWQIFLRTHLLNTVLQAIVIIAIILLSANVLLPFIQTRLGNDLSTRIIAVLLTLAVIAPFIWALALKQPRRDTVVRIWSQTRSKSGFIIFQALRIFIAVLLIGLLVDRFFSPFIALATSIVLITTLILLSKRIQKFYLKIEDRFLDNYYERENKQERASVLAPWDAHLSAIEVKPEWEGIGKTLKELRLREEYGINVATISRGSKTIHAPERDERLYPYDTLSVIGTDEQLDRFRQAVELPVTTSQQKKKSEVILWHFVVSRESLLVNQTIRESSIREKTRGIVVGVESKGKRIINPESSMVIGEGDIIWIVGDKLRLLSIKRAEEREKTITKDKT
jgi:CPA2 family monovalent cation:H+ antiporter-2